jgi:hypothetical protein
MLQREIPDCCNIRIPESDGSDMVSLITITFQQSSQGWRQLSIHDKARGLVRQ